MLHPTYFTATIVRVGTFVTGMQNSEEFARAHGQGGGEGLLRGHPKITVYEIALEREAERYYGPD